MILGICRRCHTLITDGIDSALDDRAKHKAMAMFCERFDLEYDPLAEDLVDEMRRLVRVLDGGE